MHDPTDDPQPPTLPLAPRPALAPEALDQLWSAVDEEQGAVARLQALPTLLREALAVAVVWLIGLVLLLPRTSSLAEVPILVLLGTAFILAGWPARTTLAGTAALTAFAAMSLALVVPAEPGAAWQLRTILGASVITPLLLLAARHLLRPMHIPPPPSWRAPLLLAAPALLGLALAGQPDPRWHIDAGAALHAHCLEAALLVAGITTAVALPFGRSDVRQAPDRLLAAAATGGLAGFFVVQLTCPVIALDHLLIGHTSAGLVLALLLGAITRLSRA